MKSILCRQGYATACVAFGVLFVVGSAEAQMRVNQRPGGVGQNPAGRGTVAATAAGEEKVEIKRVPPPNKTAMVRTPDFNYNVQNTVPRVTKKPREWALFEVKYETAAKWTDELAFTYHVMCRGKNDEGKDAFSYYTATIRYIDIGKGEHMSCVAIPPSLIERYGEPVSLAIEVVGKEGKVLDSQSESLIPFPTKEWWKDSKVLDNPTVTRRNGMVDRSKTPFALINPDDYEVVQ